MENRLWKLYVARDERQVDPNNDDELEIYGRLHVFYDTPILEDGKWQHARQLGGEIPSYMFPELKEGCRQKFVGLVGDLENKLPRVIEYLDNTNKNN